MARYNILVVDDSMFMRKVITDAISEDPAFHVIATAKNGREAVELVKSLSPDAVTMDLEMPEMNGLQALQRIMDERPTPVIMLSSLTEEGAKETIRALELGAVDFVQKPSGSISLDLYKVKRLLQEKLHIAVSTNAKKRLLLQDLAAEKAKIEATKAETPPVAKSQPKPKPVSAVPPEKPKTKTAAMTTFEHIVAIGTSTGGPRALQKVLTGLPADFSAPIVIVQHMPPGFTKSLAQRLDTLSQIRVVEAEEGQQLESATAYIAPGGWHMTIGKEGSAYRVRLNKEPPRGGHRPSVDTLFDSLLSLQLLKRHIVLMTGMGSDGAQGMLRLRDAGAVSTIAESEETCVVFGMPRSAIECKAAEHVVHLHDIPFRLVKAVQTTY
jgi:two-component system, chemotaxis family, protein-glutamate methylesterase/glutaminase